MVFSVASFATQENSDSTESNSRVESPETNESANDDTEVSYTECEKATNAKFEGKKITQLHLDSDKENVKFKVRGSREEKTSSCRAISGSNCRNFVACELSDEDHVVVIHNVTAGCVLFEYSKNPITNSASTGAFAGFDICTRVGNAIYQHEGNCRDRDRNGRPQCDW